MTDPIPMLLEKAAGQGLTVLMLLVGIYFVARLFEQTNVARINDLKERIVMLETAVRACEEDRAKLWQRIADAEETGRPPV